MVNFTSWPFYALIKNYLYRSNRQLLWAPQLVWMIKRREKSLAAVGNRTPDLPAHRIVTTILPQLLPLVKVK
jgi:hypothetical protein